MKIVAIGDIHGRSIWKNIIAQEQLDKVVFVGDYFDSKEKIDPFEQIDNFEEILALKKDYPNEVVLLFGNHDYHYLSASTESYDGFVSWLKPIISPMLDEAVKTDLVQMCYKHENFIFSHAGITKTWYLQHLNSEQPNTLNIDTQINDLLKSKPEAFKFTLGENNNAMGDDTCQSPIWVRPQSLMKDKLDVIKQVVGHTMQTQLVSSNNIIFIDTLGTSKEYLKLIDSKIYTGQISFIEG